MKPSQLANSGTESGHQRAVFAWAAIAQHHGFDVADAFDKLGPKALAGSAKAGIPELKWLHHIPNGGSRGDDERSRKIRGANLKAEGVRTGVHDLCLPVRRGEYSGLYIEMKKPGKIKDTSAEQDEFADFVRSQGFVAVVCDSWQSAVALLREYLSYGP